MQNPAASLLPVAVCAVAIVFFSASQDIVFDAYRTDVAEPHERGLAAAATNLGYRPAAWIAFALSLVLADYFGWRLAFFVIAGIMATFAIATWFAPSPEYTQAPPRTLRESIVAPLRELFGTPDAYAFLALIMLFKVGDAFALKLFTPFLMDIGFTKTEIGLVAKAVFTSSAMVGAVLGGIWMVRLGLLRSMLLFGVMQAASNLLYCVLALAGKSFPLMIAATAIEQCGGRHGRHRLGGAHHGSLRRTLQRVPVCAAVHHRLVATVWAGWARGLAGRSRWLVHVLRRELRDRASGSAHRVAAAR